MRHGTPAVVPVVQGGRVRHPARAFVVSALLVSLVFVLHDPIRAITLTVLRWPFAFLKGSVCAGPRLPLLPAHTSQNARLRSELVHRHAELVQLREQLRHVQQAQTLLSAAPFPQGIIATIIGRSTLPSQQTVLLDKGEQDGVMPDGVIVDASGVIGRVMELQATTSLVMMLTDPESRVAGLVERSRETGLLVGRGRGQCEFIYLDADADIQEGDRILTAGLGGLFPKGLLLGTVVRLTRDERTGAAWAGVVPAARLSRAEEVLCFPSATGSPYFLTPRPRSGPP